jgi:small-conductance mechanosensitive channel
VAESVCPVDHGDFCRLVEDTTHNEWLARASNWLFARPLSFLTLLVIGLLVRWLVHRTIDKLVRTAAEGAVPAIMARGGRMSQLFADTHAAMVERRQQRAATMGGLLKSISTGVIASIVVFMMVAQLGYNIAPLIASAGIVGVALGFGAQSLVKDFLSGVCIILEDQFGVGDIVKLGAAAGTIEAVGLRVTRLRDVDGTVWYVRNGEILAVGNMSQEWASAVVDVPLALSEDTARVRELLQQVAHTVWEDPIFRAEILEEPAVWGVERLERDGVVMRLVVKTAPQQQWSIARELRERIKELFDAEGIHFVAS